MNETVNSLIVPGVLWGLVLFSVATRAIFMVKLAQSMKARRQNKHFLKAFWGAPDLLTAAEHASQYPARWHASPTGASAMAPDETPRNTLQLAQSIDRGNRVERNLRQQILKSVGRWKRVSPCSPASAAPPRSSGCSAPCGASWMRSR